ncbi:MAG: RNA polymerase sigma-54 factor [Planctomycetes bacterium]|nr:RNA polymerase sigma-54 factor [Planctomycetota bacterium]
MRPQLILSQRPELRLQLSPQLIQRIEILQLNAADLLDLMENEALTNDALLAVKPPDPSLQPERPETIDKREEAAAEANPDDSEARADLDYWNETYRGRVRREASGGDEDPKQAAIANSPGRPRTLQEHLDQQIEVADAPDEVKELAHFLVQNLDRNGWLKEPLGELIVSFHERFNLDHAEAALKLVQGLDPDGVGARTPAECLLLQVREDLPLAPYLRRLIEHSLDDLARNRLPKVAKDLGITVDEVKDLAVALKRNFDPFPGRKFAFEPPMRVRPDVVVEKREGVWDVILADDWMPRLSINPARLKMLRDRRLKGDLKKHLRRDVESARFLIESIEQRRRTLERVAQEIVKRQSEYLEHGVEHLKPLKMQEIADELGIHVSTVSRALKGKYVQTPQGVQELKAFFTGASQGTDGVVESRTGVRERVRELVEKEGKANPLSDEEIVDKLKAMGLNVARRTVTKYRKALKIPSSRQRREY